MSFRLFHRDRWTPDNLAQLAIAILSPAAIYLLAEPGQIARYGFVVGLCSQPFWIYATAKARQLGMFAISLVYLAIWIRGIANHFPELFS